MQGKANHIRPLLFALFLLATSCTAATGKVIYVNASAIGVYDGSSWANGYRCLQDAIAEVRPGDEIRVANGIYQPDRRTSRVGRPGTVRIEASGDRAATFELINGVTFKGGYAGYDEPDPNARDIDLYETILSGDLGANDIDVNSPEALLYESSRAENSYHVLTSSGTAVLDGFTISGGNANAYSPRNGGGLYNQFGTVQVTNCTFSENSAQYDGGGIYNYRGNLSLANCTFTGNLAGDNGGGIYNYQSDPSLANCTFRMNSAQYGGGGIHNNESSPSLANCAFSENSARYGGGMYNDDSSPALTNCAFSGNSAYDYAGGMYNTNHSNLTLNNCIFTGNQARLYGGAMSYNNSGPTLTNCTFTGNRAPDGNALAFNGRQSTVGLINCILWDGGDEIWNFNVSTITISYSNIQGGWRGGEGNIDVDPLFVDPVGPDNIPGTEDDNLRLAPLSPCVDAGDPDYVPGPDETDFNGNPRIVSDRIDMGAYEFQVIIYVDDDAPYDPGPADPEVSDPQEDGTDVHPFDSIQEAIDIARDGDTVLVLSGVYDKIDFRGKAITVAGTEGAAVIGGETASRLGGRTSGEQDAVTFHAGEGPDSVLKNFVIRNSGMAISLNYGSSPTISNITIVDNDFGIAAYENSNPDISNCILWNNNDGDLFQCAARYSCIEDGAQGEGNISVNPLFVDAANGDYHLKSEGHRWDTNARSWTYDHVTSPCIDAGDPASPLGDELMSVPRDPNNYYGINLHINMGAFGGTPQASMPPYGSFTTPPEPNPAQWAPNGAPREVYGGGGILDYWARMTATEATDAKGSVEYFFECTTKSALSSGWQSSRTYNVLVGRSGQGLRFRVKARDIYGNETEWSEELPAD
jgi:parallel beta-helix repeat protein